MPIDPYEEPQRLRPTNRELPPIGVGIDYGTVLGRGGAGARFFGEGNIRLRPADSLPCPFEMTVAKNKIKIGPGTLSGLMAKNYLDAMDKGLNAAPGFVLVEGKSDGKILTEFSISVGAGPTPATPTTPLAPTSFKWPIGLIIRNENIYSVYRLIGCASLVAVARETARVPRSSNSIEDIGYDTYYTWTVANSLEPTFISIQAGV